MLTQSETKRDRSVSSSLPSTREERSRSSIYLLVAPSLPRISRCSSRIDHGRETRRTESRTRYSVCERLSEDLSLPLSLSFSLFFVGMRMFSVPDTVTSSSNVFDLGKPRRSYAYTLAKCTYRPRRIGERDRERGEEEEEKKEEEEEKKGPNPASKRLDSEPKRNKLLRELVAVVILSRPFVPPFFL